MWWQSYIHDDYGNLPMANSRVTPNTFRNGLIAVKLLVSTPYPLTVEGCRLPNRKVSVFLPAAPSQ